MQDEIRNQTLETPPADAQVHDKEIMPSLEELLKTAELQAAEHHDAWLRAKAETENMRRRAAELRAENAGTDHPSFMPTTGQAYSR